ncbi:hypothetical protein Esti_003040 [Eimeria stiedai]
MEYDEQVSARLHMSLDEIIGQEQHDESTQVKKRRSRRVPPGASSPLLGTTSASSSRPPSLPTTESASRYAAPVSAPLGGPGGYPSRPLHTARPLPALMRGPPGRLSGPPPFGLGPRPPYHLPLGHARVDSSWPRIRHVGGGFLVPSNGAHPPPPPAGAGPGMRLVGGKLGDTQPHHHPMSHQMALGAGGPMPPQMVGDMEGSLQNQMHRMYDARGPQQAACENRAEYFDCPYPRNFGHVYGALPGDEFSSNNAPFRVEGRNRYEPSDPSARARDLPQPSGPLLVREADAVCGSSAGAPSADCKEFTVIVSNVPKDLPAVEIQEAFSCMGTVLRTDIMLNSKGEHTGRVCIAFATAEAAKTAVAQFDEGDLNGNTIRVFAE